MDLDIKRYQNYRATGPVLLPRRFRVGLLSIEMFGYQNRGLPRIRDCLGKALQLTNILRDVRTDAERGRIYLPLSELARFKVPPEEILRLEYSRLAFSNWPTASPPRARHFYQLARETLPAPTAVRWSPPS